MVPSMPPAVRAIFNSGAITADDVLTIRREVYGDGAVGDAEALWLFKLNACCAKTDPAWEVLYVEALTDFLVLQMEPRGYVTDGNADWLFRQWGPGPLKTLADIKLVLAILQKSSASPERLHTFALEQVKHAVLTGQGPLRERRLQTAPSVCAGDVEMLRQAVFAFGAGGNVAVSREEAELLLEINDATAGATNDPAWEDFFAKALGNHLMMAATRAAITREEAAARDRWLDDTRVDVGGFFHKMAHGLKDVFKGAPTDSDLWDARERERQAAIAASERVTEHESHWLAQRLDRDGSLSRAEAALLRFIKAESPDIHPALKPLLARVA